MPPKYTDIPLGATVRTYLITGLSIAAALFIRLLLDPIWAERYPYMPFVFAVFVVTQFGGKGEFLFATLGGFFLADWFFIQPRHSLNIAGTGNLVNAGFYFLACFGIQYFAFKTRQAISSAKAAQEKLEVQSWSLRDSQARFENLFEHSPVAIWVEDWGKARLWLENLRREGVNDLNIYLKTHPERLREVLALTRVLEVNSAAIRLTKAENKENLQDNFHKLFTEHSLKSFHGVLVKFWNGAQHVETESCGLRIDGTEVHLILSLRISRTTNPEGLDWSRVIVAATDINDRKQAEQELARLSTGLSEAQEIANMGSFVHNLITDEVRSSPQLEKILGLNPGHQNNSSAWSELLHPEDRGAVEAALAASLKEGIPFEMEYRIIRRSDGKIRWLRGIAKVERDQEGNNQRLSGVNIDITESQEAKLALHETQERYGRLFEVEPDAILVVDIKTGKFIDANPAALRLYGYNREQFLMLTKSEVSAEPHKTHQAIEAGLRSVALRWHRKKDGTLFPVEIAGDYFEAHGRRLHVAVVRDITQRKQAEAALRESELKWRSYIENAPVGVLIANAAGRHIEANPAAEAMLGYNPGELLQTHVNDIPDASALETATKHFAEVFTRGVAEGQFLLRRKDGQRIWASVRASLLPGSHVLAVFQDISEIKRLETALRQSEQFALSTLDALTANICVLDQRGQIMAVNRAWRSFGEATGFTSIDAGVGANYLAICDTAATFGVKQALAFGAGIRAVLAGERESYSLEYDCHSPNEKRWFSGTVTRFTQNNETRLVVAHENLTPLKLAQEQMRQSEERLRAIYQTSPDPIGLFDADANIVLMNASAAVTFGYDKPHEMNGRNALSFFLPEDCERMKQVIQKTFEIGAQNNLQFWLIKKDGSRFPAEFSCAALYAVDGKPNGIIAITRDITERKRAEEALMESEARYRLLFNLNPDGVFAVDPAGVFLAVNPACEHISGYTQEELLHKTFIQLCAPDELERTVDQFQKGLRGDRAAEFETTMIRKDGRPVRLWIIGETLITDGHIKAMHCTARDITERKLFEERLRQSQKMEGIGHLAGGVAHEFNNILAGMMLSLTLAQQQDSVVGYQAEITDLQASCRRAADLVKQLLAFSRQSVMQQQPLDLADLISHQLKMLRQFLGEHVVVELNVANNLPWVNGDKSLIEQVVLNLSLNARDAMKDGGRLCLALNVVEVDETQVQNWVNARIGRFLRLSVSDTGRGMDERIMARLFEPFFTTKEVGKGTGLGLATVRGIIEQHRGWIQVESQIGKGSTFQIYLPAIAPAKREPAIARQNEITMGSGTILVVEDEPHLRGLIHKILTRSGYHVLEACNGEQALGIWSSQQSEIDLLFTDMVMPGEISGLDLAQRMMREKVTLKAVITSGYNTDMKDLEDAALRGIIFLPKPCPAAVLTSTVAQCLHQANSTLT